MLNKVMLIGRLGQTPDLRYASNGTPIATLHVCTDESYTDKNGEKVEKTEWHKVVVFQRVAENCANYLVKGSLVFVEGSLQTRKYQDKDGNDKYSTEVKAQRVQFLDKKREIIPPPTTNFWERSTPRGAWPAPLKPQPGEKVPPGMEAPAMDATDYERVGLSNPAGGSENTRLDDLPF